MERKTRILRLNVSLVDAEPKIWRSLLVPDDYTLSALHAAIQGAMGWELAHMYEFRKGKRVFGPVDDYAPSYCDVEDDDEVELFDIFKRKGSRIEYMYDFGDSWRHEIVLMGKVPFDSEKMYPACVGGERAGPPEDIGGMWRYNHIVKCVEEPESVPSSEMIGPEEREWLGDDFDPASFDVEKCDERTRRYFVEDEEDLDDESDDYDEGIFDEDLWDYDPDTDPAPQEWLDMDEAEQMLAVLEYHRPREKDRLMADQLRMHAAIHAVVETQIASNDPPITKETLGRLRNEGMDRHEIIHAIGAMVGEQIYRITNEAKPFDEEQYASQLRGLNQLSWRRYCDSIDE